VRRSKRKQPSTVQTILHAVQKHTQNPDLQADIVLLIDQMIQWAVGGPDHAQYLGEDLVNYLF
jgi:hypothetical protein